MLLDRLNCPISINDAKHKGYLKTTTSQSEGTLTSFLQSIKLYPCFSGWSLVSCCGHGPVDIQCKFSSCSELNLKLCVVPKA